MRKLITWLLVTLGIAALVRRLRRRDEPAQQASQQAEPASQTAQQASQEAQQASQPADAAPAEPAADDPADELRRRLADSRSADEPANAPTAPEATVEERRADVHEQGRATLDEMRPSDEEQ